MASCYCVSRNKVFSYWSINFSQIKRLASFLLKNPFFQRNEFVATLLNFLNKSFAQLAMMWFRCHFTWKTLNLLTFISWCDQTLYCFVFVLIEFVLLKSRNFLHFKYQFLLDNYGNAIWNTKRINDFETTLMAEWFAGIAFSISFFSKALEFCRLHFWTNKENA